jgi:hypothetical protein
MLLASNVGKLGQSTHTSVSNGRFNMKRIQFNPGESKFIYPTCRFDGFSMVFSMVFPWLSLRSSDLSTSPWCQKKTCAWKVFSIGSQMPPERGRISIFCQPKKRRPKGTIYITILCIF